MPTGLPDNALSKTGAPPQVGGSSLAPEVDEDRATLAIAMRLRGYTYKQIQAQTGFSRDQLQRSLFKAREDGKLSDVVSLMDNDVVPTAVEHLRTMVGKGDREAVFQVLKGRGVFRNFSHSKAELPAGTRLPQLSIEVITPPGAAARVVVNNEQGAIIGTANGDD